MDRRISRNISRGDKIVRVNSICISKSINLREFFSGVGVRFDV